MKGMREVCGGENESTNLSLCCSCPEYQRYVERVYWFVGESRCRRKMSKVVGRCSLMKGAVRDLGTRNWRF